MNPVTENALKTLGDRMGEIAKDLAFTPIKEAEMPRGFPPPTPVGEIEIKRYPAYRMAQTESEERSAFWTLFKHIKRNKIAMTAPVEMGYESTGAAKPVQSSMAFLYGNDSLGKAGSDGAVRVVDVLPQMVVSVGVRGNRTQNKIVTARKSLLKWIEDNSSTYRIAGEMRVMGYNSPFVPAGRKYFEVQIPITGEDPTSRVRR